MKINKLLQQTALSAFAVLWIGCQTDADRLPYLGEKKVVERVENGQTVVDSVPHTISDFAFTNQQGQLVSQKDVEGKVYVADFFFTSCPTICPRVKKQMKRVYEQYKDEPNFVMISHTIDTKFDTVARLAWYGEKLGIAAPKWHLVTGEKDSLYRIAYDYLLTALEDKSAPGGFDHSGAIALIDKKRRIRGLYDGLDSARVTQMMVDIKTLLREED